MAYSGSFFCEDGAMTAFSGPSTILTGPYEGTDISGFEDNVSSMKVRKASPEEYIFAEFWKGLSYYSDSF
jgi:hypothetical protein